MGSRESLQAKGAYDVSVSSHDRHHAEAVLDDLAHGVAVSLDDRARAEDTLVELLWSGQAGDVQRASRGLEALSDGASPEDRMRLFGEIVASGERALPSFDRLAATGTLPLSPKETAQLRATVESGSPEARLQVLAELLSPPSDEGSPGHETPVGHRQEMLVPRSPTDPAPQARSAGTGEGGRPKHDDPGWTVEDLWGGNRSPAERIAIASALSEAAVPHLLAELGSAERGELAAVLLLHLAKTPRLQKLIHDSVRQIEADDRGLRDRAELIGRKIEQDALGLPGDDPGVRSRIRNADLGTSVLERALSLCDRPSLLLAAAGREVAAIPLAMVRLGTLRGLPGAAS